MAYENPLFISINDIVYNFNIKDIPSRDDILNIRIVVR